MSARGRPWVGAWAGGRRGVVSGARAVARCRRAGAGAVRERANIHLAPASHPEHRRPRCGNRESKSTPNHKNTTVPDVKVH